MPTSIDPPPADDEIECGRCGAHVYYGLSRCPNCGVNLYEPDESPSSDSISAHSPKLRRIDLGERLDGFIRRFTKKPYAVDELFGASINQAELMNDLIAKVRGDRSLAERLVDFERQQLPHGNRITWIRNAIERWERDNRTSGSQ